MIKQAAQPVFSVQVEPVATGMTPQKKGTAFTEITAEKLEQVGDFIQSVATYLAKRVQKDELTPSELSVEFGVGLKGDASIPFLAKGSVETNFKVSAKWDWRRQP